MITGTGITEEEWYYRENFSEEFAGFIRLVNKAELSFEGEEIQVDGKITDSSLLLFNKFETSNLYESALMNAYSNCSYAFPEEVKEIQYKLDKLHYLNQCITELKMVRLYLKELNGQYIHKKFKFKNSSKDKKYIETLMTEKNVQEYFLLMSLYTKKMELYLENFRNDIHSTSQVDLPIPNYLKTDPNASTAENPLIFFEYLITRNGIQSLTNAFKSRVEDYSHGIILNERALIITHFDYDSDGHSCSTEIKFSDLFQKKLREETLKSKSLIRMQITQILKIEAEVHKFLLVTVNNQKRLLNIIKTTPFSEELNYCRESILTLVSYINLNFEPLFTSAVTTQVKSLLREAENVKPPKFLQQKIRHPYAFNLIDISPQTFTGKACFFLKDTYVTSEHFTNFANVFNGDVKEEQLIKIPWQKKYNQKFTYKKSLFYLFYRLQEEGLIERVSEGVLKQRLRLLFCNKDNTPFGEEIHNNLDDFLEKRGKHARIDEFISSLRVHSGSQLH